MNNRHFLNEKKILLIEAQEKAREFFLKGLEAEDLCVITAESGLIGIQKAQEELPHLILSEILIPDIDGYSILAMLRQNFTTASIPLIFVSTQVTRTAIRKGMELGADDYITKPCTIDELLRAIAACLEKRALLRDLYLTQFHSFVKQPNIQPAKLIKPKPVFPCESLLNEVFSFIEENYHRQITLSDVAVAVGYSSTYLTNLVRRQTGQTVQNWIIERRMAAARTLLLETNETVEEIAAKVGYHSLAHFFRQFRQHHQTSPQAWRREHFGLATDIDSQELPFLFRNRWLH